MTHIWFLFLLLFDFGMPLGIYQIIHMYPNVEPAYLMFGFGTLNLGINTMLISKLLED